MTQGDDAVAWARQQIGKPYVWGTAGPNTFDCSGLVYAAYRAINPPVYLGRTTYQQIFNGKEVSANDLAPGDLIFPYSDISHVQLYAGNGKVIEAPNKDIPVRETNVTTVWRARRVGTVSKDTGSSILNVLANLGPEDIPGVGTIVGAANTTAQLNKILEKLTSRVFWLQMGTVAVGTSLVVWGIIFLNRGLIIDTFNSFRNQAKELASFVVQGYTFGLGASAIGASATNAAVSTAGPKVSKAPPIYADATVIRRQTSTPSIEKTRRKELTNPTVGRAVVRNPRPIPRPSGLSDEEFLRRLMMPGNRKRSLNVHTKKVSEGGPS